jgi:Tfp pilus assembly protein PilE
MQIRQRCTQRGVTLGGLLVVMFVVVMVGILSLKLIPSYIEYGKARAAIQAIGADRTRTTSVAEVRKAFDSRATIDDITTLKSTDLDVTKEGNEVVISFAYRREIPLFANVGLYIDFAASSKR